MPKKIDIKKKINLYRKKGWHQDIVAAYDSYKKSDNTKAKKYIEDHYHGKKIIWEGVSKLFDYLKRDQEIIDKIVENKFNKKFFNKIFDDYSVNEKLKKIFEKKEIKIGNITNNYLIKKILEKKKINFLDFSIIKEIIIIENLINDDYVDLNTDKIIQKPLSLKTVKRKIKNLKKSERYFYSFLDEYLSFILKKKKIEMDDFKKRNLIVSLIERKKIKYKKYGLTRKDLL